MVYIKTKHIYADILKYAEVRFYTSNYELDTPLSKKSNWFNEGWGMWKNNGRNCCIESQKSTKRFVIKDYNKFKDYKICLQAT